MNKKQSKLPRTWNSPPLLLVVGLIFWWCDAQAQIDLNTILQSEEKAAKAAVQKEVSAAKKAVTGAEKKLESSAALAASMAHDSIVKTLQSEGSMVIDEQTAKLVGDLKLPDQPTEIVTNSIIKVPAGPDPVQLDYPANKGDTLHIRLKVNRWKSLHEVSVVLGERVLFHRGKTNHKDSARISVGVPEDGTISLRLYNRMYRPASVEAIVGIQPRKKVLVAALKQDTVYLDRHQTTVGDDTVGITVIDASYTVTPRSDITGRPYMLIPLTVPDDTIKQSPGWAYWIGFTKDALNAYESLKSKIPGNEDPLTAVALGKWPALPEVGHSDVSYTIGARDQIARFKRSLPVTTYGSPVVAGDSPRLWNAVNGPMSMWQKDPPFLMVRNNSTLYEYTIYVKVIALNVTQAIVGKDDKVAKIQKSILLQYQ